VYILRLTPVFEHFKWKTLGVIDKYIIVKKIGGSLRGHKGNTINLFEKKNYNKVE
jgi:hypothetical protein